MASAKLSLAQNNLQGEVFPSNVFSDVKNKYDFLISNPPFHSGKETDYQAAETFISQAPTHLKNKGILSIVANKFLKYEPLLQSAFTNINVTQENNKFKVLTCIKSN